MRRALPGPNIPDINIPDINVRDIVHNNSFYLCNACAYAFFASFCLRMASVSMGVTLNRSPQMP